MFPDLAIPTASRRVRRGNRAPATESATGPICPFRGGGGQAEIGIPNLARVMIRDYRFNMTTTNEIEILTNTPNGNLVEYDAETDAETVETAVGDEWRVDWETPSVELTSGRCRSPIFRQVTLTFGCSDPSLGYEAWQVVFAELAAHLKSSVGEDLHGDSWVEADEGCQITADAGRIDEIRAAIEAFDGPISVYESVSDDVSIALNAEGYPIVVEPS